MPQISLQINRNVFNEAFLPFLFDYSKRYNIYYGGRGSGKSYFIVDKLIIKALNEPRKVLFLRKTAASLKDSLYLMVMEAIDKFHIRAIATISKSTYTITLSNGSVFLFKGLDDGEKAKGIVGLTDIFIDEANQLSFEDFNALDKTLRHRTASNQQIYLAYNPVSKANWVYKHWHEQEQPNTFYMKSTYKDNKFVPQDFKNSLENQKITNPTLYKIEALGEFASLDKLVYSYWRISDEQPPKGLQLLCGLDFGYVNDATAFVASYIDEANKKIYIVDEMYEKELLNNQISERIKYMGYAKETIIGDSAEEKSIAEMRQCGITRIKGAKKGKGSVLQGIQKLQQYELIVNPRCENVIRELQNYAWKKDKSTGEHYNEPIDDENHALDALRYSLQCVGTKLAVMNASGLGL